MGTSMKIKENGVWIPAKGFRRKENDQWVDVPTIKAKFGGDGWHEVVPPNAIILYDLPNGDLPNTSLLCNGLNNGTPNLIGEKFVQMTTNPNKIFYLGGSAGHNGTAHGSYSASTNSNDPQWASFGFSGLAGVGININRTLTTSHTHTTTSHSHSGYVYHNGRRRKFLQPTMFDDVIRKDAVFLNLYGIMGKLEHYIYGGFLVLSDDNTIYSQETDNTIYNHTHDTALSNTSSGSYTYSTKVNGRDEGSSFYNATNPHSHLLSHKAPSSGPITFPNQNFYTGKTTGKLYWDELPYGTVCFFTDDLLPEGWQPLISIKKYRNGVVYESVNTEGMMTYLSSNINSNTTANPKHVHMGTYTTGSSTERGYSRDSGLGYAFYNHTHTVPDNHSTEVNHTPPFVTLFVGYKVLPTYTITFDANGGEGVQNDAIKTYKINLKLPECSFTNSGRSFKCWNTRPDGYGASYNTTDVSYNIDENITLYAIWNDVQIEPGTYSPSKFGSIIDSYISVGGSRTVKNEFTATVNKQQITVPAGATIYRSQVSSGSEPSELIGFGKITTDLHNVVTSFTTYKTYCTVGGTAINFRNYGNFPITIGGTGIKFN